MTIRDDTREALTRCHADLAVLIYLARCDGVFHQKERDLVEDYLARKCRDLQYNQLKVHRRIRQSYPNEKAFEKALIELAHYPKSRFPYVARTCERLIAIDGQKTKEELETLGRVRAVLPS